MRVTSSKPRGQKMFKCVKFKHNTSKRKVKRPFWIEPVDGGWFCLENGQWQKEYNGKGGMSSSYYSMTFDGYGNAYSLKAVKKLINRWDVPNGTKFRASLPFCGYDFYITK